MRLNERDYQLSMAVSRRRRNGRPEPEGMRDMLIHRLRDGAKMVLRLPMSRNLDRAEPQDYGVYCEPCGTWAQIEGNGTRIECECGRVYKLEFAVYAVVSE